MTRALKQVSLMIMRAPTPKRKATKVIHPDLSESARFDPINLQKERFGEESEGKKRQTERWHCFSTF
jgi:hypothetical protein